MLKLVNIKKDYSVAGSTVHALRGVSLEFRKNEFVSILGPSGCGKTTLLNIIGGLDQYTSGDLVICGKSTKSYKDGDWDSYRNHRIGFVFQSYNLIPHQTILGNVELALTIGGMSASERKKKAAHALKRVGLGGQMKKYPNQLSGGQMQRVAIARALVNDPEILLADEPTGALDTQTSVQIMELIKEIARDKLVIMVTHNPELAMRYSTRIVRLLDGSVVEDSAPYDSAAERAGMTERLRAAGYSETQIKRYIAAKSKDAAGKEGKTNMSFATSLALSAKNLWSKKGRTAVTAVAGSIGIIGVCLVLAISAGIRGYIVSMQDDMLSGNPVVIRETGYNVDALTDAMGNMRPQDAVEHADDGLVYVDSYVSSLAEMGEDMASMLVNNEITAEYVDYVRSMPEDYYAAMTVSYGIDVLHNLYTGFTYTDLDGAETTRQMSVAAIQTLYTELLGHTEYKDFIDYISMFTDIFAQAPDSSEYILSQYDVLKGEVADEADEVMIVLNANSEMTDLTLAQLGYLTQDEFMNYAYEATDAPAYDESLEVDSFTLDEIMGKTFTWYPNDSVYKPNAAYGTDNNYCEYMYTPYGEGLSEEGALSLKVVGVLRPKENISYGCLDAGIYYTQALAEYAIEQNKDSAVALAAQKANDGSGFYSGYYEMATADPNHPVEIKMGIGYTVDYVYDGVAYDDVFAFAGLDSQYALFMSMMGSMGGAASGSETGGMSDYKTLTSRNLGGEEVPNNLRLYPVSFDSKNLVTDYLDAWNDDGSLTYYSVGAQKDITLSADERDNVTYTDSLELIITLINNMIDIITYGLVAFTSISLVVSSVMIGVITYVSVVERTKEIGVLRSLGARKRDVSNLFNAETFIIGLLAGAFGVGITYLLSFPFNLLLGSLTGIYTLVSLPWWQAVVMICVSFLLTMLSGLFPARAAAKKDPVIALRTE